MAPLDPDFSIVISPSDVEDGTSTTSTSGSYSYGQVRLYPDGQVRLYTESRENSVVDESEDSSEASKSGTNFEMNAEAEAEAGPDSVIIDGAESDVESEKDEEVVDADPVTCDLCGQAPCDWELFGEGIWDECNGLKEQGGDNKTVRFHAYKMYTWLKHGVLSRFDCRPLPVCLRSEILDSWPDPNHEYVGFQQVIKDAAEDVKLQLLI